jgi:hypothetical protein
MILTGSLYFSELCHKTELHYTTPSNASFTYNSEVRMTMLRLMMMMMMMMLLLLLL